MWFVCCSYRPGKAARVYETKKSPLLHVASCSGCWMLAIAISFSHANGLRRRAVFVGSVFPCGQTDL